MQTTHSMGVASAGPPGRTGRCRQGLLPSPLGHGIFPASHTEGSPPALGEAPAPGEEIQRAPPPDQSNAEAGCHSRVRGQRGKSPWL